MLLDRIKIKNFRSVEELTVDFKPQCRTLVGINESGKSNILRALSMLSEDISPSKEDMREVLPDEPPVKESYVWFIFLLEEPEIDRVCEMLEQKTLTTNNHKNALPILKKKGESISLEQFCRMKQETLYVVNVPDGRKYSSSWKINEVYETFKNWKKPSPQCPANFTVQTVDASVPLKNYIFIDQDCHENIPQEYLSDISFDDVNNAVDTIINKLLHENLPEVIYWTYNDKNLLPAHIDIAQFAANPAICIPLKHMFELTQITEIKKAIEDAKSASAHGLRNLLNRVAETATKHLHNVWKEYKTIEFHLIPNGNNIDASVKDVFNHYEFSMRSDGFKRFVTFLLSISARVKTNQLQNALLLIDEPDMSLHPSGAKYLRDELIKISKKNFVIYSTHSIFMIDRDNIKRHLIVKKEDERTSIHEVDESNIVDEEVIYNALGYSLFESLKKKNIVFEGWRDKRLCEVAIQKLPSQHKHLKDSFKEVGFTNAKGVKDIQNVTSLLELANRECLILSDDDNASKEKQKEYIKNKNYGVWKRYSEVLPDTGAITGEDFIKPEAFYKPIDAIKKKYPSLPEISDSDLLHVKGKIYALQNWLRKSGIDDDEQKEVVNSIKGYIFEDLKPTHIESTYYELLSNLIKLL